MRKRAAFVLQKKMERTEFYEQNSIADILRPELDSEKILKGEKLILNSLNLEESGHCLASFDGFH